MVRTQEILMALVEDEGLAIVVRELAAVCRRREQFAGDNKESGVYGRPEDWDFDALLLENILPKLIDGGIELRQEGLPSSG